MKQAKSAEVEWLEAAVAAEAGEVPETTLFQMISDACSMKRDSSTSAVVVLAHGFIERPGRIWRDFGRCPWAHLGLVGTVNLV